MNDEFTGRCPLCGLEGVVVRYFSNRDMTYVECSRCRVFEFSNEVKPELERHSGRHLLSALTRSTSDHDRHYLQILTTNIDHLTSSVPQDKDVIGKSRWLLRAIARRSDFPGDDVRFDFETDCPLACAQNDDEFLYFLRYLGSRQWITLSLDMRGADVCLTPEGWGEMEQVLSVHSHKAFVAMWFDNDMRLTYDDAIVPALKQCGYDPIRIDDKEYLEGVVDEIIAEIRESRFVVADITGQRQGVYFEGGYAKGLGLPVVWMCRKGDLNDVHFDTKHLNLLVWESHNELIERLVNRVRATIGIGPRVVSAD